MVLIYDEKNRNFPLNCNGCLYQTYPAQFYVKRSATFDTWGYKVKCFLKFLDCFDVKGCRTFKAVSATKPLNPFRPSSIFSGGRIFLCSNAH